MSFIKSHPLCYYFKKYSGVPFYFKTSRDKPQPGAQVLEQNPPFLRFNAALEMVSIDYVDKSTLNGNTRGLKITKLGSSYILFVL